MKKKIAIYGEIVHQSVRLKLRSLKCFSVIASAALIFLSFSVRGAAPTEDAKISVRAVDRSDTLNRIDHFVVIYQENHSFDNLYGGWEGVNGISNADLSELSQINQAGIPFQCLEQDDPSLTSPSPLPISCTDTSDPTSPTSRFNSFFVNAPFTIDSFIPSTAVTCPNAVPRGQPALLPGGCTRDLVHRFYQEQYQLNGGKQNRYVTGSDAIGLSMGVYDTKRLPIYAYLHSTGHPRYAIADNFFQAAFGGSFLNHQWLVAAASPFWTNADQSGGSTDLHSIVDGNGMPNTYPLYKPTGTVKDAQMAVKCPSPLAGLACGDYAVNTTQPTYQPFAPGTPAANRLPPLNNPTIGDRLSQRQISWAWYSGGWSNANGDIGGPGWTNGSGANCSDPNTISTATFPNCPNSLFQFHHQAFNFYAAFAPGTPARSAHLRDEQEFIQLVQSSTNQCNLNSVSFIKPLGDENEHPGYTNENSGSNHLIQLIRAVEASSCARNTMIIITYDEFGGAWDHVPPPGQGGTPGPSDQWGPGTRIPALIISPLLRRDFVVDHTQYDTTSIMATFERRFDLDALGYRDGAVNELSSVFNARAPWGHRRNQ